MVSIKGEIQLTPEYVELLRENSILLSRHLGASEEIVEVLEAFPIHILKQDPTKK